MSGYNSHHWGAPTASGQSTGEGGNVSGRYGSSLEMEPMIAPASSGGGGSQGQSKGSSKYHGKRSSSLSTGRMVLVTLACLAMLYFGYGVGRDDGLETAKQPNASPTPSLVRKPPTDQKNEEVKPDMTDRPNDEDEPSDEDDKDADVDAPQEKENDEPSTTGSKIKPVEEDPADAVVEDEAALQDNEDEDDDATQDFAPDGDNDDAAEDDDSTEDFDDEDKDGHVDPTPEEKLDRQNLEDDDNVVDDDTVSKDTDDDNAAASADDDAAGSSDDDQEDDANAIAKKLVPNGVSDTPTTAYRVPDAVHNRFVKWSKELHQISEMEEYKGGEPKVNWEWHPRKRADRFPVVDDRVSAVHSFVGLNFNSMIFEITLTFSWFFDSHLRQLPPICCISRSLYSDQVLHGQVV